MRIQLEGRRAVVSGSTQGIGYAIARGLAAAGAAVVVNGRSEDRVAEALEALQGEVRGATLSGVAADLGNADGITRLLAAVAEADILVNNLGIFAPQPFFEVPDAEWQRFFEVNVMSGVRLSRAYVPGMVTRGWGRVVFISSESGVNIPPEMVHYGMTKTAQIAIARGLAESVAGSGVTVNSVLPGPTRSEGVLDFLGKMSAEAATGSQEEAERAFIVAHRPTSLIKRFASVEEVAAMVVYLCSEQASATTGAALRVEGGLLRSIL
jgi:NAD(P)-dependent dehydrogenase (short-subunit alcohol dehydrogenase family)